MPRPLNPANKQYLDANSEPLAGGKLYTYVADSSTPKATYSDPEGNTPNSNPVILDSSGWATVYTGTGLYKLVLKDADDVEIWSEDDYDGNPTTGEDGIDGKSVRYGSSDPVSGDGNDGDFWINTTSKFIFGPKADGTWPSGISLIGPGVPSGGTAGQLLSKNSGTDFDAEWIEPPESLPTGGTIGQSLVKQSSIDGDANWQDLDTDLVAEGDNLYYTDERAETAAESVISEQKGAASGLASLDAGGKIPSSQLPNIAITDTFVVDDQTEMLALSAEVGDVAVRTDESKSYILQVEPASTLSNWVWLQAPEAGQVDSVNGQTGTVSLDTDDVEEGSTNQYFTDERAQTAAVVNTLSGAETNQAPSVDAVNDALLAIDPSDIAFSPAETDDWLEEPANIREALDNLAAQRATINLMTAWASYTPTFTNMGSPSSVAFKWRRVGNDIQIRGYFLADAGSSSEGRISFPNSLTTPSTIATLEVAGSYGRNVTSSNHGGFIFREPSVGYLTFSPVEVFGSGSAAALTKANGNVIGSGVPFSFEATAPISQWEESSTVDIFEAGDFGWTNFTMVPSATTSAPSKGGTTKDHARYRGDGDSISIRWDYVQTSAGNAGNGTYLYPIPGGLAIDTSKQSVSTTPICEVGDATVANSSDGTSAIVWPAKVYAYDATNLFIVIQANSSTNISTSRAAQGSSTAAFNSTNLTINLKVSDLPISTRSTFPIGVAALNKPYYSGTLVGAGGGWGTTSSSYADPSVATTSSTLTPIKSNRLTVIAEATKLCAVTVTFPEPGIYWISATPSIETASTNRAFARLVDGSGTVINGGTGILTSGISSIGAPLSGLYEVTAAGQKTFKIQLGTTTSGANISQNSVTPVTWSIYQVSN